MTLMTHDLLLKIQTYCQTQADRWAVASPELHDAFPTLSDPIAVSSGPYMVQYGCENEGLTYPRTEWHSHRGELLKAPPLLPLVRAYFRDAILQRSQLALRFAELAREAYERVQFQTKVPFRAALPFAPSFHNGDVAGTSVIQVDARSHFLLYEQESNAQYDVDAEIQQEGDGVSSIVDGSDHRLHLESMQRDWDEHETTKDIPSPYLPQLDMLTPEGLPESLDIFGRLPGIENDPSMKQMPLWLWKGLSISAETGIVTVFFEEGTAYLSGKFGLTRPLLEEGPLEVFLAERVDTFDAHDEPEEEGGVEYGDDADEEEDDEEPDSEGD